MWEESATARIRATRVKIVRRPPESESADGRGLIMMRQRIKVGDFFVPQLRAAKSCAQRIAKNAERQLNGETGARQFRDIITLDTISH